MVGGSAAGLAAAETLRREGYEGTITLIGDEPYHPYDRPPLSKQILGGQWEPDRVPLRAPADLDALGLDLRLGVAATGLDLAGRTVALADGARVPYEGLVIATGVRPRRLPGDGNGEGNGEGNGDGGGARMCCAPWTTPWPCGTGWARGGG